MSDNKNFVGTTNLGKTNIQGDIDINNDNTNINSTNLKIKDNIITLNAGEQSDKISKGLAGLEFDRGTSPAFKLIYDETDTNLKVGLGDNLIPLLTQKVIDENSIKSITGKDSTITVTKNNNTSNVITINNVEHAINSTKALQDNKGQQIDTTYIKNITSSNNTITITKGNNSTSNLIINNVSHATNSDNSKKIDNTASNNSAIDLITGAMASTDHFKLRIGGNNDDGYVEIAINDNGNESIYVRQYGGNGWNTIKRTATLLDGNGNTTFPGTVNASSFSGNATSATKATNDSSNRNIVNTYAIKVSPAFSGTPTAPTPGTSDNGTRIATTGFVHNILNRAVGKTEPTLTSLINWDSMKSANDGTDVRNIKNTTYGTTAYGGDAGGLNKGDII